jgi:cytochrome b561
MQTISQPVSDYRTAMRVLHWLMALCVIILCVSGLIMTSFEKQDSLRMPFYEFHKSVGAITLALALARVAVRFRSVLPEMPSLMPPWEKKAAHAVHMGLYMLMICAPLTGWAISDFYGYSVTLFSLPLPKLFPTLGQTYGSLASQVHTALTYTLMGFIMLHLAAIAKHRYVDRHCVMHRMA